MENKLFTIVNRDNESSFLTDLSTNPDNFNKKLVFVFGNSENYIVVNGEKFLHKPESAERTPVDLRLPSGTLWAAGNIGAELPWETGLYFAFGETTGFTANDVANGVRTFIKEEYVDGSAYNYVSNLNNRDCLDLEHDAAYANLGDDWRIPTKEQFQELVDYCNYSIIGFGDTKTRCAMFTSKINGNTLVLPGSGCFIGPKTNTLVEFNKIWYWTKTVGKSSNNYPSGFNFSGFAAIGDNDKFDLGYVNNYVYSGLTVRAVIPGEKASFITGTENGYEWVNLGLSSGLKWATCNIGASNPQDYGLYFAWGETTGYTGEQVTGGERAFSEEEYNSGPAASISANLTLEQDAAHTNLGGKWRIPTQAEIRELIDYCNYEWTDNYNGTGVAGSILTSKINGATLFFPAAGWYGDGTLKRGGERYFAWSINLSHDKWAYDFVVFNGIISAQETFFRSSGISIRGVCE